MCKGENSSSRVITCCRPDLDGFSVSGLCVLIRPVLYVAVRKYPTAFARHRQCPSPCPYTSSIDGYRRYPNFACHVKRLCHIFTHLVLELVSEH